MNIQEADKDPVVIPAERYKKLMEVVEAARALDAAANILGIRYNSTTHRRNLYMALRELEKK